MVVCRVGSLAQTGRSLLIMCSNMDSTVRASWGDDVFPPPSDLRDVRGYGLNRWLHIAVSWDGKFRRLFCNGACLYEERKDAHPLTSGDFIIGGGGHSQRMNFRGLIKDVRIWNSA